VFIERLWRSLKHEDIYLKGYADGREAKAGIALMVWLLQHQTPAPSARQQDADGGLARGRHGPPRRDGCRHDALGQRWRVAHMPTAATTQQQFCGLTR
jgi:hypothetical protein